jgi:catechol 2,3-dioxygenase-like lactoylglutathione lyase family enzyme
MKVNSISGITCQVEDLSRTAAFYEAIGFRRGKEEPDRVTFYVNWFFMTFIAQDRDAEHPAKGAGMVTYIKVDDIDGFYEDVLAAGMEPDSEPEVRTKGSREFVLRDPDGYQLAFFYKK